MTPDELPDTFTDTPLALLRWAQWLSRHGLTYAARDAWMAPRTQSEIEAWVQEQIATDQALAQEIMAEYPAWRRRYKEDLDEDAEEDHRPPFGSAREAGMSFLLGQGYLWPMAERLVKRPRKKR